MLPQGFSKIHKKFNSAYFSEAFVLISVVIGIYSFDVVGSIKLSSFFILIYYTITNLCVIKLDKENRLYSVGIAYYGFTLCLVLATTLIIFWWKKRFTHKLLLVTYKNVPQTFTNYIICEKNITTMQDCENRIIIN